MGTVVDINVDADVIVSVVDIIVNIKFATDDCN